MANRTLYGKRLFANAAQGTFVTNANCGRLKEVAVETNKGSSTEVTRENHPQESTKEIQLTDVLVVRLQCLH